MSLMESIRIMPESGIWVHVTYGGRAWSPGEGSEEAG